MLWKDELIALRTAKGTVLSDGIKYQFFLLPRRFMANQIGDIRVQFFDGAAERGSPCLSFVKLAPNAKAMRDSIVSRRLIQNYSK